MVKRKQIPMELLLFLGILVLWIALQLWILPKLGIPTCMSGACRVERKNEMGERAGPAVDLPDGKGR
jgi:hypothetical protein